MCLCVTCVPSLEKCLFLSFDYFLIEFLAFLLLSLSSLYRCWMSGLCPMHGLQPVFSSDPQGFPRAHTFHLDEVQVVIFLFMNHAFDFKCNNNLCCPRSWNFSPLFFSKTFIVLHVSLCSILSSFLNKLWVLGRGSFFQLTDVHWLQHHLWKVYLPLDYSCTLVN